MEYIPEMWICRAQQKFICMIMKNDIDIFAGCGYIAIRF
jgi:hypothetical protein